MVDMDEQISYGKTKKRIIFTDTDHRHAQLVVRLRHDNLTQSDFFRLVVSGYLSGDTRIQSFIDENKDMSKVRKAISKKLTQSGKEKTKQLGFSDEEITDIFDIIAEEHPEL